MVSPRWVAILPKATAPAIAMPIQTTLLNISFLMSLSWGESAGRMPRPGL
jgi:hypothetical protein